MACKLTLKELRILCESYETNKNKIDIPLIMAVTGHTSHTHCSGILRALGYKLEASENQWGRLNEKLNAIFLHITPSEYEQILKIKKKAEAAEKRLGGEEHEKNI